MSYLWSKFWKKNLTKEWEGGFYWFSSIGKMVGQFIFRVQIKWRSCDNWCLFCKSDFWWHHAFVFARYSLLWRQSLQTSWCIQFLGSKSRNLRCLCLLIYSVVESIVLRLHAFVLIVLICLSALLIQNRWRRWMKKGVELAVKVTGDSNFSYYSMTSLEFFGRCDPSWRVIQNSWVNYSNLFVEDAKR